jgi:hypothetical protein
LNRSTSRHFSLAAAASFTGALLWFGGTAQAANSASFQISPPTANYAGDPGSVSKGTMKITNLTDTPLVLNVSKQNFVAKGEEGEIELVDNANPLYSLAPWFNIPSGQVEVGARATKEVTYTISIPANAEPGGRYGSIVFSTIPPKLPSGQSGATVQQNLAGVIFQRINGDAKEELKLESFATEKSFYEYAPIKFFTRISNQGNVHEKPTGTITIKNFLGMKVAEVPLDEHFIIPGSTRRLTNVWPDGDTKPWLIGKYTAELKATYTGDQTITDTTTFVVVPWKPLAAAGAVLIVIFLVFWKGRKRLSRAVRILAGRE